MEPQSDNPPLIIIVGQTASGKSALALDIAERWDGEIIAADSRTVYRGMDIGTAKPSRTDRQHVPHHLLDIRNPDESFTVQDFKQLAEVAISDITKRGRLAILAGGTGLYIDAILFDFAFRGAADPEHRARLNGMSVEELQELLRSQGWSLPRNERNPRHLIRSIESQGRPHVRSALRSNTLVIGLEIDKEALEKRIIDRVDAMLAAGLEQEVSRLSQAYGWQCSPMQTIGYQEFRAYLAGEEAIQTVRQSIITHTRQYAKRQKTWFSRNQVIHWISNSAQAVELATTFLNK
jgi:tRNA dimethylallyltransferase